MADVLYVEYFWVAPKQRRKGVGKCFAELLMVEAKRVEVKLMLLQPQDPDLDEIAR